LELSSINQLGRDFIMKLEWISQAISLLDYKCKDNPSGNTKDMKPSLDFTTVSQLNSVKNVLTLTLSTGIFNLWAFSSQNSKQSL
jgi:hypothetical protein